MSNLPFVSCLMPTKNRREFVPKAIAYWLRQDYPNRELVILDDGDSVVDLVPDDDRIKYYRSPSHLTLGEKRNMSVRLAEGDLLMHWDDDDWMSPKRISIEVEAMQAGKSELVGYRTVLFWDIRGDQKVVYYYQGQKPWVFGATILYTRDFWNRSQFPDRQVMSDSRWMLDRADINLYSSIDDLQNYVAIRHGKNVASFDFASPWVRPYTGRIEDVIPAEDLEFYSRFKVGSEERK